MKKIVCVFVLFLILSVPALAVETDDLEAALPDSAREDRKSVV